MLVSNASTWKTNFVEEEFAFLLTNHIREGGPDLELAARIAYKYVSNSSCRSVKQCDSPLMKFSMLKSGRSIRTRNKRVRRARYILHPSSEASTAQDDLFAVLVDDPVARDLQVSHGAVEK